MRTRRAGTISGVVRAAAAVWLSSGASVGLGQTPMPAGTRLAVRVEEGTAWRSHAPTRRLVGVLGSLGALEGVKAAWEELTGALGLEEGAAFDALLGKSVVFSMGAEGSWGILGSVTAESGRKLEAKLDPAPRGFEDGRAVMLVERGRFRLTKLAAEGAGDGVRMVLTPGEGSGPIDMTTAVAAALGVEGAGRAGGGRAAWFWRGEGEDATLRGTVVPEDHGWGVSFRGTARALGMTETACEAAAQAGAGEEAGRAGDGGAVGGGVVGGEGLLLEVAGRVPGDLPGVGSATRSAMAVLAAAKLKLPGRDVMGDGVVVRLERGRAAGEGARVLVACEVKDRVQAAEALDAMMVSVLELAGRLSGAHGEAGGGARDFRGEIGRAKDDPSAVRLVVLGGANGEAGGTLAWTIVPGAVVPGAGKGNGGGAGAEVAKPSGWWVAQFIPGTGGRDEAERALQAGAQRVAGRAWGSVLLTASVRPAELWREWERGGLGAEVAGLAAMKDVERVELTVRASGAGVSGVGRVVVTPKAEPGPRPAKAP